MIEVHYDAVYQFEMHFLLLLYDWETKWNQSLYNEERRVFVLKIETDVCS